MEIKSFPKMIIMKNKKSNKIKKIIEKICLKGNK